VDFVSTGDIADDLGLQRDYVTAKLTKRPDFPAPALKLSQKTVRWLRDDYEAWKTAHFRASARSARRSRGSSAP
jgi:predicted DNA-binding transcriptional regulator AlpA